MGGQTSPCTNAGATERSARSACSRFQTSSTPGTSRSSRARLSRAGPRQHGRRAVLPGCRTAGARRHRSAARSRAPGAAARCSLLGRVKKADQRRAALRLGSAALGSQLEKLRPENPPIHGVEASTALAHVDDHRQLDADVACPASLRRGCAAGDACGRAPRGRSDRAAALDHGQGRRPRSRRRSRAADHDECRSRPARRLRRFADQRRVVRSTVRCPAPRLERPGPGRAGSVPGRGQRAASSWWATAFTGPCGMWTWTSASRSSRCKGPCSMRTD